MSTNLNLSNRHALVTGGASGIGAAAARRLASLGAHVVVTDVDVDAGRAVAAEVDGEFERLDVADADAWDRVATLRPEIDLLLLNAGVTTRTSPSPDALTALPLADLLDGDFERARRVNLDGVVFGARAFIPSMCTAGAGDIIVTASIAGLVGTPFDPIYGTTKHAVVGLVKSIAQPLIERGVHISSINPGFVDTPILGEFGADGLRSMGVPVMDTSRVADAVEHALQQRVPGAQWVVWGDAAIRQYEWTPAV